MFNEADDQTFRNIDRTSSLQVLQVNVLAPVKIAEAFVSHLAIAERRILAVIFSQIDSITNAPGGHYIYNTSKAGVNMASNLGGHGIKVVALHQGLVRTDMGGDSAPLTPTQTAMNLLTLLNRIDTEDSGKFLDHQGDHIS